MLLCIIPVEVFANQRVTLYLEGYKINDNKLTMQVKYSSEETFEPATEASDLICIAKMGNELTNSGFLSDTSSIQTYLEAIEVTKEDTNLYKGICEELDYFTSSEGVSQRKCVIIFSDGADDQVTGITREEATEKVKESNIPVYTIALLKETPSKEQVENSKILGSFARLSFGGKHFTPVIDEIDSQNIFDCIYTDMQTSIIVTADVSEINCNNKTAKLNLILSNKNVTGELQEDIDVSPLQKEEVEAENISEESDKKIEPPIVEQIKEPIENSMKEPKEETSIFQEYREYIIIGSIIFVLFIIGIFYILIRKKKDRTDTSLIKKAQVTLYRQGEEDTVIRFKLKDGVLIGRWNRCQVCIEDEALSEIHCTISIIDGQICISDENSTNGTYINGMPIMDQFQLKQNDTILIGSYEYKIVWE